MNAAAQTALRAFAFDMFYTGTLLHKAEVRTKLLDGADHAVPVVCMDVELDNDLHTTLHVEHPFGMGQHAQAAAEAAKFKRGMHVRVKAPALDMRLVARNASEITPIDNPTPPAAPAALTPNPQEPELWQQ